MTLFYQTSTWSSQPQPTEKTIESWKHAAEKKNWRITQLPNGFFQTEIKDINCVCDPEKDTCCEKWIDEPDEKPLKVLKALLMGLSIITKEN